MRVVPFAVDGFLLCLPGQQAADGRVVAARLVARQHQHLAASGQHIAAQGSFLVHQLPANGGQRFSLGGGRLDGGDEVGRFAPLVMDRPRERLPCLDAEVLYLLLDAALQII